MAMLTGPEIKKLVETKQIVIEPAPTKYGANSVDLRIGGEILIYDKAYDLHKLRTELLEAVRWHRTCYYDDGDVMDTEDATASWVKINSLRARVALAIDMMLPLDMAKEEKTTRLTIDDEDGLTVFPGIVYLGHTIEHTETPFHVPCVEGRSSVGRLGLSVHITAGFGDRGFKGDWTLEVAGVQPVTIYAGTPICQIFYTETVGEPKAYAGKYQQQRGPKPSMLWREFEKKP